MIILRSNIQLSPKDYDDLYEKLIKMRDEGLILFPYNVEFVGYFPDDKDDEEELLTCRQLLAEEHPERIDPYLDCGCKGCPDVYGYISKDERLCNVEKINFGVMPEGICTRCWSQIATKYYEEKEKNK